MKKFQKLPSYIGLANFASGEWSAQDLKFMIDQGIVSAPSLRQIDQLVEAGSILVDLPGKPAYQLAFTQQMKNSLLESGAVRTKKDNISAKFTSEAQRKFYELLRKAVTDIKAFAASNEALKVIESLSFVDDKGSFKVQFQVYFKNGLRALRTFKN